MKVFIFLATLIPHLDSLSWLFFGLSYFLIIFTVHSLREREKENRFYRSLFFHIYTFRFILNLKSETTKTMNRLHVKWLFTLLAS